MNASGGWRGWPGATVLVAFLEFVGECATLLAEAGGRLFRRPFEGRETLSQMAFLGVSSVPIVAMTGFLSGAVLALYLSVFLRQYGATGFVGATVGLTMTAEVGPVISGIMVASRCGSAMAAQIGTMRVTEQIDALRMLSVNPAGYLVLPRLLAGVLMMPVLALVSMWSGILGGLLVAQSEGIPAPAYISSIQRFLEPSDVLSGMSKTPWFGLLITLVACQQGLRTTEGAVGVGRATTNTVVLGVVLVYVADFILARLLNH